MDAGNILAAIAVLFILLDLVLWHTTGPHGWYRTHILLQIGALLLGIAVLLGAHGFVTTG